MKDRKANHVRLWEIVSLKKQIKAVCPVFNSVIEKPRTQRKKKKTKKKRCTDKDDFNVLFVCFTGKICCFWRMFYFYFFLLYTKKKISLYGCPMKGSYPNLKSCWVYLRASPEYNYTLTNFNQINNYRKTVSNAY